MVATAATAALTITLDLENHRLGGDPQRRYQSNARRIFEFLEQRAVRATIFIVGDIIADCHDLIRAAKTGGHELALHSATHTPLTAENATALAPRLRDARARLEDIGGDAVCGFRAPVFSLTPDSVWITDVLAQCGFRYSSSILPAPHPLFGYPGAPAHTFRWPSGIVEFPVPLGRIGPLQLPFLGGIYLRYLPLTLIRKLHYRLAAGVVPWTYLHPYDIDAEEPYYRFPGTSAPMSLLLWRRRRNTLARLGALLDNNAAGLPFAAQLDLPVNANLPDFSPLSAA